MVGFDYELVFTSGSSNAIADELSLQVAASINASSTITNDFIVSYSTFLDSRGCLVHLIHMVKNNSAMAYGKGLKKDVKI